MFTERKVDVYLIHDPDSGYYKIGYASCARKRLIKLLKQDPLLPYPFQFVLVDKWYVVQSLEKELHERYRHLRVRGEWFALTDTDVNEITVYMDGFDTGFPKYRDFPNGMPMGGRNVNPST